MILITLSQVFYTRFLWPLRRGDNGWLVNCGHYHIVGDRLVHNSQETILTVGTAWSMVKTMKQELEVDDTLPQCSDILVSSFFIELFDSSASEDLTPPPSSTKLSKGIFLIWSLFVIRDIHPCGSIQSIVSYLCTMVLQGQTSNELWTLDYDNILVQKSNSCQLFSMGTSCLNCHPSIWMFNNPPKCKAWIERTMTMLGVSWSQPI